MSSREVPVALVTGHRPNSGWIAARSICAWRIENRAISVEGSCICFIDTDLNEEKVLTQFLSI